MRERFGVHGRGQHERDRQAGTGMARARPEGRPTAPRMAAAAASRGGRRGRGGEQLVVPRARPDSYYGKPIIKEPPWGARDVGGYLFFGGLAGASSVLAGFAQAAGNHKQAKASKIAAAGAIGLSGVALVADLGRPERFLNMLRVFKPTSPMSVGSWLISAFGGASAAAAACAVTGRLPKVGAAATAGAALVGPGHLHVHRRADLRHRGARLARRAPRDALPVRRVRRQRGGRPGHDLVVPPEDAGQAVRFAVLGAATEITAKSLLLRRLGDIAEPYQTGRPGKLMEVAEVLTAAGLAGAVLAGGSRTAIMLAGAALVASSALTRLGIFEAGRASARDPKYVVRPQRERLAAKAQEPAP